MINSVKVLESEVVKHEFKRENGIIGLMDRGGSNLAKINDQFREATGSPIVRLVVTTQASHPECNARKRAEEFNVPLVDKVDFLKYEELHGVFPGDYFLALKYVKENDDGVREKILSKIKSPLKPESIIQVRSDACRMLKSHIYNTIERLGVPQNMPAFGAGCMSLLSEEFVDTENQGDAFYIENVHPGDLTKHELNGIKRGLRNITGDGWIPPAKAISAGHEVLYSSMHHMDPEMDAGRLRMRGYALRIDYNRLLSRVNIKKREQLEQVGRAAQDALKYLGDHVIAGATFWDLFEGNWGVHKSGVLAYRSGEEWYLAANGIMIEDHVANNPNTVFKRSKEFIDEKVSEFYSAIEKIGKAT